MNFCSIFFVLSKLPVNVGHLLKTLNGLFTVFNTIKLSETKITIDFQIHIYIYMYNMHLYKYNFLMSNKFQLLKNIVVIH